MNTPIRWLVTLAAAVVPGLSGCTTRDAGGARDARAADTVKSTT